MQPIEEIQWLASHFAAMAIENKRFATGEASKPDHLKAEWYDGRASAYGLAARELQLACERQNVKPFNIHADDPDPQRMSAGGHGREISGSSGGTLDAGAGSSHVHIW